MATILRCKVGARMRPLTFLTPRIRCDGKTVRCVGGPFHGFRLFLNTGTLPIKVRGDAGTYGPTGVWFPR